MNTTTEEGAQPSLIDRFARALARIVHEERPEALSRQITVAELYQDIAPYRRMRELAGLEMHGDYEHALLRLLAGEGGYARLDPESAADELGIEAESSDPDLSLYRKFAACDVRLSLPEPMARSDAEIAARPVSPEPQPIAELAARAAEATRSATVVEPEPPPPAQAPAPPRRNPSSIAETLRALDTERPRVDARRASAVTGQTGTPAAARCAFCAQQLPAERDVRFCPHCGVDQSGRQCGGCGADMEAGWRFCIACGAAAES